MKNTNQTSTKVATALSHERKSISYTNFSSYVEKAYDVKQCATSEKPYGFP